MVMEPSPQCVGREFVKQYYTMLNQAPNFLHRFYSHNSSFLHSAMNQSSDDRPTVVIGQAEIHKQIMMMDFRDCHAKIHQVDSQLTVDNGVVVQVIGELANNNGAMRPFVQTFVLAAQSTKKYYVHNDIFRYQDDIFRSNGFIHVDFNGQHNHIDETFNNTVNVGDNINHQHASDDTDKLDESASSVIDVNQHPVSPPAALTNGMDHGVDEISNGVNNDNDALMTEPIMADTNYTEPVAEEVLQNGVDGMDDGPATDQTADRSGTEVKDVDRSTDEQTNATELQTSVDEGDVTAEPEPEVKQSKAMSWAAMLKTSSSSSPSTTAATAASRPAKSLLSPSSRPPAKEQKPEMTQVATGKPRVNSSNQEGSDQESGRGHGSVDGGDDVRRPFIPPQIYPDNQQLFIGNLPQYLCDRELHEFFDQFGPIIEMKINRKSGNINNLPNFGFIVFENTETVQKILSQRPLFLNGTNGRHRINVEEKKGRAELAGNRPRSASRGGIRPSGYGRGASDGHPRGAPRPGGGTSSS